MKSLLLFSLLPIATFNIFGQSLNIQDSIIYQQKIEAGEAALKVQNYQECLSLYKTAFQLKGESHLHKMRAALCAYQAEEKELFDKYLSEAFTIDWVYAKQTFYYYPEFAFLKNSPFEKSMNTKFMESATKAGVNVALMTELSTIEQKDQKHRKAMRAISKEYGWESSQMDSLWALQNFADSINIVRIEEIIAKHGYPGKSLVGKGQASTAFLVIQHADLVMQEKYLSLLTEAADAGEIRWRSLALLIDRINLGQGKKQIYGSQYARDEATGKFYFLPIENPHKIDSIRATVGLRAFQKYAERINIKWDADAHIEFHEKRAEEGTEKK